MKTNAVILALSLFSSLSMAQVPDEKKKIESAIISFAKFADSQDSKSLDELLDKNFRLVMNQLFGSKEVVIMTREIYLEKISKKEFGGDKREVKIENLIVVGKNASARVQFKGAKMKLVSLIHLVQNSGGEWKLVNDVPTVI